MQGGRESNMRADGTIKINPISPCSHPNFCQKLNREVRHSPTWHSSESESALERFEPVAVVQQLPDGRGSVFARVAARRQKEIKRGIPSSFCPFRSFRTSEKNSEREEKLLYPTQNRNKTISAETQKGGKKPSFFPPFCEIKPFLRVLRQ